MNTMKIKDSDIMMVKNHPAKQRCDAHRSPPNFFKTLQ